MEKNFFSNEMLNCITTLISGNESEISDLMQQFDGEQEPKQAAVNYLMEKYGITVEEAEEIVEDLNKGVRDFTTQMDTDALGEPQSIETQLQKLTAGCSVEETHRCYANILTTLQILGSGLENPDEIEQRQNSNLQKGNEELLAGIKSVWDSSLNMEQMSRLVNDNIKGEGLRDFAKMVKLSKENYRMMTALWLYTSQRDGKIKLSESKVPITAQMIGALASAGIEAIIATSDLSEGKISLEKWQSVMKCILGALFIALLFACSIALIAAAGIGSIIFMISLLGSSMLSLFIAMGVFIAIVCYLGRKAVEWDVDLLNWLDGVYDKVIVKITEKVRTVIANVKKWLSSRKNGGNSNNGNSNESNSNNGHNVGTTDETTEVTNGESSTTQTEQEENSDHNREDNSVQS